MRIGHYMAGLSLPGGANSYLMRVAKAQRDRGHEIVLFDDAESLYSNESTGFETIVAARRGDVLRQASRRGVEVVHAHSLLDIGPEIRPFVVRTQHGHHAYCPSGSRYLARSRLPCPRSYSPFHCTWGHVVDRCGSVRPREFLGGFQRMRDEQIVQPYISTIAISAFTKSQMIRSGCLASKINVVYNPAPTPISDFAPPAFRPNERPRFIFAGRIVPGKGLRSLLQAAAKADTQVEFEILGDGPERGALTALADSLGLGGRVVWQGWINDESNVLARLVDARALIIPSLWHEPAGLVTLEAAAAGRAVIASAVGGIPEYGGKLGNTVFYPPGDVDALAAAISLLSEDVARATDLGRAGWEALRSGAFAMNQHLDSLEEIYAGRQVRN